MLNVWKSDLYRVGKSKLLYSLLAFTGIIAFSLIILIRQDIRFGISVFGDLTAFKKIDDIVRIGTEYHKGLGILVAIFISVFIGQEYQWKTWEHKWITSGNRYFIYLSKALLSSAVSVVIFLIFQTVILFFSGRILEMLTSEYISMIICSSFIYAALGTVICLLSMLIKNNTGSTIICLCYILFSETFVSVIKSFSGLSNTMARLVGWGIQHSIYGMASIVHEASYSTELMVTIVINSIAIMILSTVIGLLFFPKYEL